MMDRSKVDKLHMDRFKIDADAAHMLLGYMMQVESNQYGCHVVDFATFHLLARLFPRIEFDEWTQNRFQ